MERDPRECCRADDVLGGRDGELQLARGHAQLGDNYIRNPDSILYIVSAANVK